MKRIYYFVLLSFCYLIHFLSPKKKMYRSPVQQAYASNGENKRRY